MKEIKGILREKNTLVLSYIDILYTRVLVHVEQYISVEIKSSEIYLIVRI